MALRARIANMTLPAPIDIQGKPYEKGFRVLCNVCGRPVDMWKVETPIRRAAIDPLNPMDAAGMIRMENTGEIIFAVECHGEKFKASNRRGLLDAEQG
jgi:hypothetical protein